MKNIMIITLISTLFTSFVAAQDQTLPKEAKPKSEIMQVIDPELDPFGGVSTHGTDNIDTDNKEKKAEDQKEPTTEPNVTEP